MTPSFSAPAGSYLPATAAPAVSAAGNVLAAPAPAAKSGKTPGQLARERELAFGVKQLSEATQALLRKEAAERQVAIRAAQQPFIESRRSAAVKSVAQSVRDYAERKGYEPVFTGNPNEVLWSKSAPGAPGGMTTLRTSDLKEKLRKSQESALRNEMKAIGWKKKLDAPGSVRGNEDLWVRYDDLGNPIDYATWDELSTPEMRKAAYEAKLHPSTVADSVANSNASYLTASTSAQQAEAAADAALQSMFSGMGDYVSAPSSWVKNGGVLAAAGLLLYALHRLRRKGKKVRRVRHG